MCFDFAVRSQHRKVKQSSPLTELTLNDGRPNYIDIMERSNSKQQQQQHSDRHTVQKRWPLDHGGMEAKLKPSLSQHLKFINSKKVWKKSTTPLDLTFTKSTSNLKKKRLTFFLAFLENLNFTFQSLSLTKSAAARTWNTMYSTAAQYDRRKILKSRGQVLIKGFSKEMVFNQSLPKFGWERGEGHSVLN